MRILPSTLCAAALLACSQAAAADLTVTVVGKDGKPVANAVASLAAPGGARGPIKFPWPYVVAQKNVQFDPYVLIVPVGAEVSFPNRDKVRHHVYSFSRAKRFEIKLYGRQEEAPSVRFDKPGTVALGCNIHDAMIGYIRVVETPYAAKTDANGKAVLHDVPAGGGVLTVWHPDLRGKDNAVSRRTGGGPAETVAVELRPHI